MTGEVETTTITCTVSNSRAVISKSLFALVDVEVEIGGVIIMVRGVQARRTTEGTAIMLPSYKDADGSQRAAIILPQEVKDPLFHAILAHLVETGLAKPRYGVTP